MWREEDDGNDLSIRVVDVNDLLVKKFEILSEEDEEIDIDSIKEVNLHIDFGYVNCGNLTEDVKQGLNNNFNRTNNKINELIKAVKQLNKKLEEK